MANLHEMDVHGKMLIMKTIKKILSALFVGVIYVTTAGFTKDDFSIEHFKNYKREFVSESIGACSTSSTKTYEDYRMITNTGSAQYKYIHEHMTVDKETGFLFDEDGFVGVAMGYQFGEIGSRYYVVLDTGNIIPVVKVDSKAAVHAENGCSANADASVIEFVIHEGISREYFGQGPTGLAAYGNFNNYEYLNGKIVDIEKVTDQKIEEGIVYDLKPKAAGHFIFEGFDDVTEFEGGYLSE